MLKLKTGMVVSGKTVVAIGNTNIETTVVPVKFDDGTHGIVATCGLIKEWVADLPHAASAIRNSLKMPEVCPGMGSDAIHIRGIDLGGDYLVKLFCNKENGHEDELHR